MIQSESENKLIKKLKEREPIDWFNLLMIISLIIFSVFLIFNFTYQIKGLFFFNTHDAFMDFFNSIRDVSHGIGVYTEKHVIYPPLANLIFLILSKFLSAEYLSTDFENRYTWVNHPQNVVLIIVFSVICLALYFALIFKYNRKKNISDYLFLIFSVLNVPILHTLERGNLILLTIFFIGFFFYNYKSENKILRELSLISLAIAFGLKLYPALFGWLLIINKRYKEAVRTICYGILALLIPSFFFGGPICIWWMLKNISDFSSSKMSIDIGIFNVIQHSKFWEICYKVYSKLNSIIFVCTVITFLFYSFKIKENWKLTLFICLTFISLPPISSLYNWGIFLIPMSMLIKEEKLNKKNIAYFIGMALPFLFIPKFISRGEYDVVITSNSIMLKLSILLLSAVFIYEAIAYVINYYKNKQTQN